MRPKFRNSVALPILLLGLIATSSERPLLAQDKIEPAATQIVPIAIFPFQERGREVAELGDQVTDLLFAELVAEPGLYLVERADLAKVLDEQKINLAGFVDPKSATQIGRLTGAKILLTGSILRVGETQYVVGKVISAETGRVLGASAKADIREDLDVLVRELAEKISDTVAKRAGDLIAKSEPKADVIATLKKTLGDAKRPTIFVSIPEQHVGRPVNDPAAETEFIAFCKALGFDVIDSQRGNKSQADVVISGEGLSELATRHGDFVSVKARVEVKAVDRETGKVLAVDRQTTIGLGLAEITAGKSALQTAAAQIAERLLPKLAVDESK